MSRRLWSKKTVAQKLQLQKPLTDVQMDYLDFIARFIKQNGYAPSRIEMADHFGVNPNAAQDNVYALHNKGAITITASTARAIRVNV